MTEPGAANSATARLRSKAADDGVEQVVSKGFMVADSLVACVDQLQGMMMEEREGDKMRNGR